MQPEDSGRRKSLRELIESFRYVQSLMNDDNMAAAVTAEGGESIADWNKRAAQAAEDGEEAAARLGVTYNDFVAGAPIGVWKEAPESSDEPFTIRDPSWSFGKRTRRAESLIPPAMPPSKAPHRPFENNREKRIGRKTRDYDT